MSQISLAASRGNPLIGLYGYSRGITPGGWEAMKDFIRVESQISPQLFIIANLNITDDSVISRSIVTLDHLRQCLFYESYGALNECREHYIQRAIDAGMRGRMN